MLAWATMACCFDGSTKSMVIGVKVTYVNIKCNGMPSFSAIWMCAKLGGFAIMASATNGFSAELLLTEMPLSKLILSA